MNCSNESWLEFNDALNLYTGLSVLWKIIQMEPRAQKDLLLVPHMITTLHMLPWEWGACDVSVYVVHRLGS